MVTVAAFRKIALAMPDASEAPHFETASFRVKGKIFATLLEKLPSAVLKLTPDQQEMMTEAEPAVFERVAGGWGDKGWTRLHLKPADAQTVRSALATSYANVVAKKPKAKRRA